MGTLTAKGKQNARDDFKTEASHIALYDDEGSELSGGNPAYARVAISWTNDGDDKAVLNDAETPYEFNVPEGSDVSVIHYVDHGTIGSGDSLGTEDVTKEDYASQGIYRVTAGSIEFSDPAA